MPKGGRARRWLLSRRGGQTQHLLPLLFHPFNSIKNIIIKNSFLSCDQLANEMQVAFGRIKRKNKRQMSVLVLATKPSLSAVFLMVPKVGVEPT